ncbi:unnamed protein product [Adineta steineri]|uniref:Uncharacterized protein n=1 Tax=Adineta steineri TaxID=433720 RepID=A0A815XI24_9BILA|nr:unnamed protein product [Adineta steineri]CAF1557738.1 unnamed protein product [Adineta steineri]
MSKNSFFRKRIKPAIDVDDDDGRRDVCGRKRVDVIDCLFDSSSDDNDDTNILNQNTNILWLTFAEICHIRSVLTETTLSTLMFNQDKQYSKIIHGNLCFRCRKQIYSLFFLSSFLYSTNSSLCYICQQRICKKCSLSNFLPPLSTHLFPVQINTLMKLSSNSIENEMSYKTKINPRIKSICYDCSQIFNEPTKFSRYSIKISTPDVHQSFFSRIWSFNFNITRYL